ncbi:hypothetical protein FACS1894153_3270 [Bacteroidia bacterium]|nr:hypothetical protein FACS1894153_3270 [Bacteroidia bacterium]
MKKIAYILVIPIILLLTSCSDEGNGFVRLNFQYKWGVDTVLFNSNKEYQTIDNILVSSDNVEFFISEIKLYSSKRTVSFKPEIVYFSLDSVYSSKLFTWSVMEGTYNKLEFVFGIPIAKNTSNSFVRSPEKDMFWPDVIGGGYHFLKFDGKWRNNTSEELKPFNIHIGNYFDTIVHEQSFSIYLDINAKIEKEVVKNINIICDLKRWLETPYKWDFSEYPNGIMELPEAMDKIKANGRGVFTSNNL